MRMNLNCIEKGIISFMINLKIIFHKATASDIKYWVDLGLLDDYWLEVLKEES